jgi:hypothetical protein
MSYPTLNVEEMRSRGYITVAQAAALLRKSQSTVRRDAAAGKLGRMLQGQIFVAVDRLIEHYGRDSPAARAHTIELLGATATASSDDEDLDVVVWICPQQLPPAAPLPTVRAVGRHEKLPWRR